MKQCQASTVRKIILFVFLALVTIIITVTCTSNDTPVLLPEAVQINKNGIKIAVYPEMELLSVILFLSDYRDLGQVTNLEFEYEQSVRAYFADFKEHEAITLIDRYIRSGLYIPLVATLMINHDFSLDRTAFTVSDYFYCCDSDSCNFFEDFISEFISVMKSFYIASDFKTFYLSQRDFYTAILEQTAEVFPEWNMISVLESFYGKNLESYNVVLPSLFGFEGYGLTIMREYDAAAYFVMGSDSVNENGLPVFDNEMVLRSFTGLTLHEFGHSFLGLIFSDDINIQKALEDSEYLMEPIREKMERTGYPLWSIVCEELILRTVVIRILADNQETDIAELLRWEYNQGFIYIHTVYDFLQKYIDDRESYPAFDDFIPILIGELMQIHSRP